jgi:small subunit ribosomal protein S9
MADTIHAVGRRKEAVCRVYLKQGSGKWEINGRTIGDYFPRPTLVSSIQLPFSATDNLGKWDVTANIDGGGTTGQAGALRLAVARALCEFDPELRPALKKAGFLTRDARVTESKKYGLKKARKAPQYSKR